MEIEIRTYDELSKKEIVRSMLEDAIKALQMLNISGEIRFNTDTDIIATEKPTDLPLLMINGVAKIKARQPHPHEIVYMLLDEAMYEKTDGTNFIFEIAIQ